MWRARGSEGVGIEKREETAGLRQRKCGEGWGGWGGKVLARGRFLCMHVESRESCGSASSGAV